jgi:spore coat polysaccharide biosynthesis protein SpsF
MKIVATIEARMTSTRLPGKVLLEAGGKSMLRHLVDRLKTVPSISEIVLATTINNADNPLEAFAKDNDIKCYRGSEHDVMSRVIEAAASAEADIVVEITGDCPIIDPQIVEQTIRMFVGNNADYASNSIIRSYPDGMDTQVFRLGTLQRSAAMTNDPIDHEHVTLHMCNNPDLFSQVHLIAPPDLHWPELGLTLDEPADYVLISQIIEFFELDNPLFTCLDVLRLLQQKPEWVKINKSVLRKGNS